MENPQGQASPNGPGAEAPGAPNVPQDLKGKFLPVLTIGIKDGQVAFLPSELMKMLPKDTLLHSIIESLHYAVQYTAPESPIIQPKPKSNLII